MSRVEVRIDELVLLGFGLAERDRIAAAVQQELTRLIRKEGVAGLIRNPMVRARLDAGTIRIRAGGKAKATGAAISGAIYRSLNCQTAGVERVGRPVPGVHLR